MSERFCGECGRSKGDAEQFCVDCGYDYGSSQPETRYKPGMSKRSKGMLIVAAVLLGALFSAHFYIQSMISPEEQIIEIYEALHKGDEKQLFKALDIAGDVHYDPQVYMDSLQYEEPATVREEMTAAVQRTKTIGIPQIITSQHIGDFLIVEQKKFLGVYKRIHITALDYEVKVETDLPSGKIAIGEKEWDFEGESFSLGRFLPGAYVAVLSNESLEEDSVEMSILVQSNRRENVYTLDKEDYMISFEEENEGGLLFINGTETGMEVSELQEVGPFFTQSLIELSLARGIDGKSQRSESVRAYPGEKVTFSFALEEEEEEAVEQEQAQEQEKEQKQQAQAQQKVSSEDKDRGEEVKRAAEKFVSGFRSAYEKALNTRDFSLIAPYLKEGTDLYEEFAEFIRGMKNESYHYDFIQNAMLGTVIISDGVVEVDTYEEFNFTNHLSEVTHYKREKTYHLLMSGSEDFEISSIKISDTIRQKTGGN